MIGQETSGKQKYALQKTPTHSHWHHCSHSAAESRPEQPEKLELDAVESRLDCHAAVLELVGLVLNPRRQLDVQTLHL